MKQTEMSKYDENSLPSPAYMRIRQYVVGMIVKSHGEAQKIMSLSELCDIFKVSVPTARKALKELVVEGMLIPKQGMGTFVNSNYFKSGKTGTLRYIGILNSNGKAVNYAFGQMCILAECLKQFTYRNCCARIITLAGETPEQIEREIELHHLDGLIWVNTPKNLYIVAESFRKKKFPIIAIILENNKTPETIDHVGRLWHAGTLVAEFLLSKEHRKVICTGSRNDPSFSEFDNVFSKHGFKHDNKLNIYGLKQLSNEFQLKLETSGATAIFMQGDPVGKRSLEFLAEYKKSHAISQKVVSFESLVPQFPGIINDAIKLPYDKMAEAAVNALVDRINGDWEKTINKCFSQYIVEERK